MKQTSKPTVASLMWKTPIRHVICFVIVLLSTVLKTGLAHSQSYPAKPVRIVTSEPGGGSDIVARVIAQELMNSLGQQVIVENRGGASGAIAGETVAKAPPDGYTLLYYGNAIWLLPLLRDNVPYDVEKDLSPITVTVKSPNVLVLHPALPANSVKELIALAKSRPGELNYASGNSGSSSHLAAELFKSMAHASIVRVPYKGAAQGVNDLMGGQVQIMFSTPASAMRYVKAGKLKALAITDLRPSALAPGLPTVAESGLPGYESTQVSAMFAPAKTPESIVNRLNQDIFRIINQADVKERLLNIGVDIVGSSPAELAATIRSEVVRMGKVIRDAGIRE